MEEDPLRGLKVTTVTGSKHKAATMTRTNQTTDMAKTLILTSILTSSILTSMTTKESTTISKIYIIRLNTTRSQVLQTQHLLTTIPMVAVLTIQGVQTSTWMPNSRAWATQSKS